MDVTNVWSRALSAFPSAAAQAAVGRIVFDASVGHRFTRPLYWTVAPRLYRYRYPTDFDVDAAAPDPFKIERVDPDRIRRFTRRWYPPWRQRRALFGAVMDGEWDRRPHEAAPTYGGPPEELFHADRIEDGLLYRALESHFVDGVPWRDTAFVTRAVEYIEAGRSDVWHACSSPEDVLERCSHLEDVYRSLRRDGCLSYRERTPPVEREVGFLKSLEREIIVDVGRDGELLLVSGKHRLSLSRILGLESVPVCFLVRHADWMETRRAVARGTATVRDHSDHPDLRDLPGGTG